MNKFKLSRSGPYLVMAPGMILLLLFAIYPTIFLFKISFQEYSPISIEKPFVGLSNYIQVFQDQSFWNSLKITIIFVLSTVSLEFFIGLFLSIVLHQLGKGQKIFQSLILLPIAMAPTIVGLMFRFMMNDQYGVFNYFAESLGFSRISWLSDPQLALPALILTDVWQWTPFMMIILLAGLKGIPSDPYEAAKIDGATASQTFFYVTIPLLSKIIYIALLLRTIDAFRIYDTIYMMTKGGPINVTSTLSWIVYDKGFKFLDFGYGAALSVVMLILVVTLLMLFLRKVDLFNVEGKS
ncbi:MULTISPECIES: carbohydrate ABC transporter permease [Paenibacillus]|uniref:ABC transporter permease n=1 Tax=Paenibacillus naphthalenovorans TaxID=162209 RepID=A0A0U2L168_9BACL|nr:MULTISPECIES: sugar ABC transporter permease [Paenibacillus]ALS23314.1 ABC transporter permease [Paenibacillus naphthalenovorans]GCL72793.1 sugar ABC transporter permease [Paenibacillus naphthalenovorans]SDI09419.1 multiple sugar transport system permease protein [Paenibacillus naphthalenovorans]